MNVIKVQCPFCAQPVELPRADAERGLNCPSCFRFFQASDRIAPDEAPRPAGSHPPELSLPQRCEKIRRQANFFCGFALIWLIGAALALLIGIEHGLHTSDDIGGVPLIVMCSFLVTAFWCYLVAQIIHIRANTEK